MTAIENIATYINSRYFYTESSLFLIVLNGGIFFSSRLLEQIDFLFEQDYIHASRYGNNTTGRDVQFIALPSVSVVNRTVIILDNLVDNGDTLKAVEDKLYQLGARDVSSIVLFKKTNLTFYPDYFGLTIPNLFVYGCGLDLNGNYRYLPYLAEA